MNRVPPIYPVAIGISYVLSVYTGSGFTVVSLPRPIVAVLLISVAVQIILTTALRNRDKGAYFAALVLLGSSLNLIGILALIIPVEIRPRRTGSMRANPRAMTAVCWSVHL